MTYPRDDEDDFLTVTEVAASLRISKMTVYRLIHTGELPSIRVGRTFRIPVKAYDTYREAAVYIPAPPV